MLALAMGLSACGRGKEDPRMDPVGSANSRVTVSPKALHNRVEILVDLLTSDLPANLAGRKSKLAFFTKISPAVVEAMLEVEAERSIAFQYKDALHSGTVTTKLADEIADLFDRYKTKNIETLIERVDVVPLDMLFSQSAIESGWGTSSVAQDCHNIFGVHAATASQKCPGHPILAYYPDFTGSIKRYVLLLNTGSAYQSFRRNRASIRDAVGPYGVLDSNVLVEGLLSYSERGVAYVRQVAAGIQQANLDEVYREFIQKIW